MMKKGLKIFVLVGGIFAGIACMGSGSVTAADVHIPDFSVGSEGYYPSDPAISLGADSATKPLSSPSLKMSTSGAGVTGSVKSPTFTITASHKVGGASANNLAYWNVKYYVKSNLSQGSYQVRLRILDGSTPYEIGLEQFGGADSTVNGFTYTNKPLAALSTSHPNLRFDTGNNDAELVVYLYNAVGNVWISDVNITTATPGQTGFSPTDWKNFETGDGPIYFSFQDMARQPAYGEEGYVSELIMDSAYKLLKPAGFNQKKQTLPG